MILDLAKALPELRGTTRAVLTPKEAAKVFSVTPSHINNLIEEGQLGALDLAGAKSLSGRHLFRISVKELLRFAEERASLAEPVRK
jgi:excisionase family DNA binding protein